MTTQAVALRDVVAWLDDTLAVSGCLDYGPNGLQVEGRHQVRRVVTGVTANLALIEAAVARDADLLVVHHGIFWDGAPVTITGAHGRRVRALLAADISLAAYHLPLDGHPTFGNAAQLAAILGLEDVAPAFEHRGRPVGCVGRFPQPLSPAELAARVRDRVNRDALAFLHGPAAIATLGCVTGGAPRDVREAIDAGCDAYLTGEAGEYSQATAHEEGIHFFAAGHHRTERFGPAALAGALAERFAGLDVSFIDIDNPA